VLTNLLDTYELMGIHKPIL